MKEEIDLEPVRYAELRPRRLKARREALPLAYLPLGILEWHGLHNPLGLDGIKAEEAAARIAREVGGVVMPTLFWGDDRTDIAELAFDESTNPWMPEGIGDQTGEIEWLSGISKAALAAESERVQAQGGWRFWKELVVRILFQTQSFGFRAAVALPGHYPLFRPLKEAIADYERAGGTMSLFVLGDYLYEPDGKSGDHAAAFETSALMALRPELVDLSELDPDPSVVPMGVLGDDPRTGASAEYGERILKRFVSLVAEWVDGVFYRKP